MASFAGALEHALYAEEIARADGLLQRLDPRVKLLGILALIVSTAMARKLWVIAALFGLAVAMATLSHVSLELLAKRVWIAVLLFTGVIALPAPFVTPGRMLARLPLLGWTITTQGLTSAVFLIARVEAAATLSALLVLCTPWGQVLKALRVFKAPVVLVVILGMTYRYIFLLLAAARDMFESRQSRLVGELDSRERRRIAAASAGVLLSKTFQLSSDVYMAMQARGFRGEVDVLDDFKTRRRDWAMLMSFAALSLAAVWLGR